MDPSENALLRGSHLALNEAVGLHGAFGQVLPGDVCFEHEEHRVNQQTVVQWCWMGCRLGGCFRLCQGAGYVGYGWTLWLLQGGLRAGLGVR